MNTQNALTITDTALNAELLDLTDAAEAAEAAIEAAMDAAEEEDFDAAEDAEADAEIDPSGEAGTVMTVELLMTVREKEIYAFRRDVQHAVSVGLGAVISGAMLAYVMQYVDNAPSKVMRSAMAGGAEKPSKNEADYINTGIKLARYFRKNMGPELAAAFAMPLGSLDQITEVKDFLRRKHNVTSIGTLRELLKTGKAKKPGKTLSERLCGMVAKAKGEDRFSIVSAKRLARVMNELNQAEAKAFAEAVAEAFAARVNLAGRD